MNLSKKIMLASCACAAFLAGVYSCTVEERDIEGKDIFLCMEDQDCLESSVCVGANIETGTAGRCRLKTQVEPCADHDNDGYLAVDPKYAEIMREKGEETSNYSCGSGSQYADPDDTDPDVYPGATEYCDGKDNNHDGCVDGKCMCDASTGDKTCDCTNTPTQCAALTENCIGRKNISDMQNTRCSAEDAGVLFCKPSNSEGHPKGEWFYGKATSKSGSVTINGITKTFYTVGDLQEATNIDGASACPPKITNTNSTTYKMSDGTDFVFVESEQRMIDNGNYEFCDDIDHDCNTHPGTEDGGDKCQKCSDILAHYPTEENKECRVIYSGNVIYSVSHYNWNDSTSQLVSNPQFEANVMEAYSSTSKPCSEAAINDGKCKCVFYRACASENDRPNCPHDRDVEYFKGLPIKDITFTADGWCEEVESDPDPET